jgi:Tol biopolymer transport system component
VSTHGPATQPFLSGNGDTIAFVVETKKARFDLVVQNLGSAAVAFVARTPGPRTARDHFVFDVLVKDLGSGRTPRVGEAYNGSGAGLSADGRRVVFLDDVGSNNM